MATICTSSRLTPQGAIDEEILVFRPGIHTARRPHSQFRQPFLLRKENRENSRRFGRHMASHGVRRREQERRRLRHRPRQRSGQGGRLRGRDQEHGLGRHLRRPRRGQLQRHRLFRHHHRRAQGHHGLLRALRQRWSGSRRPQGYGERHHPRQSGGQESWRTDRHHGRDRDRQGRRRRTQDLRRDRTGLPGSRERQYRRCRRRLSHRRQFRSPEPHLQGQAHDRGRPLHRRVAWLCLQEGRCENPQTFQRRSCQGQVFG